MPSSFHDSFLNERAAVNGAVAVYHHASHIVGIYQLYRLCLRAKRHIVRFHRPIVFQTCAAIERGTVFEMQVDVALEHYRTYLVAACRHQYAPSAGLRAFVDGALHSIGAKPRGVAHGTVGRDIVVGSR